MRKQNRNEIKEDELSVFQEAESDKAEGKPERRPCEASDEEKDFA